MLANRDWRLLVQDIIEHGERVEQYTRGLDFASSSGDQMVIDATTRNLEIMGEATRHVPLKIQTRCPDVAWLQMNDTRDSLIRRYWSVDLGLVWGTVTDDVPPTLVRLRQLLEDEGATDS